MKPELTLLGPNLHIGQERVMKNIIRSKAMYHVVVSPRQWGKSFFGVQALLYFAINNKNSKCMWCSPTYAQASKTYKEMLLGIRDSGLIKKFNSAENSVILVNDSEIFFKSVTLYENLRGYSINYMILDECAYYKEEVFSSVLRPMLSVQGRKCILLSTPRGRNWFYKMFMKGQDETNHRYASYSCKTADNPFANLDEIEDARKVLPEALFKQEYEAQFVDGNGTVFTNINDAATLTKWQEPITGETYYAGIDIAISGDYLVLTILNKAGEVVYCYRDNKKTFSFMLEQIRISFNKYNPRYTLVETNGIGNGIYEYIAKLHRSVAPFVTTNASKQDIIEDLIFDFQEKAIKIPTKEFFAHYFEELEDFGFTYSPKTKKVIYGGISGHDDCVLSLAIANHARRTGATKGLYVVM